VCPYKYAFTAVGERDIEAMKATLKDQMKYKTGRSERG